MTVRSDLVRSTSTLLICVLGATSLWALRVPPPPWGELMTTTGASTALIDAVVFALWGTSTVAAAYLVLAAALHLVATACAQRSRAPRLRRAAARLTPRWMAVATVGVMTGTSWIAPAAGAAGAAGPGGGERRPDVVMEVVTDEDAPSDEAPRTMLPWASTMRSDRTSPPMTSSTLPPPAPTTTAEATTTAAPATTSSPATSTSHAPSTTMPRAAPRLEAVEQGPIAETDSAPLADQLPPPLVVELAPELGAPVAGRHVVVAGESFWTIAERVVRERALPVPVASYWRLLVEANRDRLVDRADPDLIHPGLELVLP